MPAIPLSPLRHPPVRPAVTRRVGDAWRARVRRRRALRRAAVVAELRPSWTRRLAFVLVLLAQVAVLALSACVALGRPARAQSATPRSPTPQPPNGSAAAQPVAPGDSLRLTRRQAVAEALRANPQIEVAREQTAQARARRVTATAIPDPALAASIDQQPQLFNLGRGLGQERNVGIGLDVPFPTRTRPAGRHASSDVRPART